MDKKNIALLIALIPGLMTAEKITISKHEARTIGKKIWKNECGGKVQNLTFWNKSEEFPSVGIGHCVWCPQGTTCSFSETFPSLLGYMETRGAKIPAWLKNNTACPWKTRKAFMKDFNSTKMKELRSFLQSTVDLQVEFIIKRMTDSLPRILESIPEKNHAHVRKQFFRVARAKNGVYALADYVNFKGTGANPNEPYKNYGWGLLQILQSMIGAKQNTAVSEFVTVAKKALKKRVDNAPRERNEAQFIPGWYNRLDTYLA